MWDTRAGASISFYVDGNSYTSICDHCRPSISTSIGLGVQVADIKWRKEAMYQRANSCPVVVTLR